MGGSSVVFGFGGMRKGGESGNEGFRVGMARETEMMVLVYNGG